MTDVFSPASQAKRLWLQVFFRSNGTNDANDANSPVFTLCERRIWSTHD